MRIPNALFGCEAGHSCGDNGGYDYIALSAAELYWDVAGSRWVCEYCYDDLEEREDWDKVKVLQQVIDSTEDNELLKLFRSDNAQT